MRYPVAFLCMLFTGAAVAQEAVTPTEISTIKELEQGWNKKAVVGGTASFGTSDKVVGQTDGESTTFGLNFEASLIQLKDRGEWRNTLKIVESTSRTPSVPRYVKASDELKFESLYLRSLKSTPWFGPYVKASVETAIFKGEDVRSELKTYQRLDSDKNPIGTPEQASSFRLTDGFHPLTTKESVGGFFKLINKEKMKLEARAGAGALQVQADGQYALDDNKDTPDIEVRQLKSYEQVGIEGAFNLNGVFDERTSYSLGGEFLTPLVLNKKAGDKRSNFELTNWEVNARLKSKVTEWMSMDLTAKLMQRPQLVDDVQVQTMMMLSFNYQLL